MRKGRLQGDAAFFIECSEAFVYPVCYELSRNFSVPNIRPMDGLQGIRWRLRMG